MSCEGAKNLKDLPMAAEFKDIKPIKKGMSSDKKYFVTAKNGAHFLLRLADYKEFERKKLNTN